MRYLFEDYALDTDRRELRRGGTLVAIEPQVFDLLAYLVQHRDRVVTKDDLFAAVWNGRFVSESALTTRINAARVAVGDNGATQRVIHTLRGRGFRFVLDEVRESNADASGTANLRPPSTNDAFAPHRTVVAINTHQDGDISLIRNAARSLAARHGGTLGADSERRLLIEFPNARSAAYAILNSERQRPELRIGAQSFSSEEDRVLAGEVASGLAELAHPGEMVATDEVCDQLTDGLDARIEDLGERTIGNLPTPLRVYRIGRQPAVTVESHEVAIHMQPMIAVIPFDARNPGPHDDVLGEVLADEIIAALSRCAELGVISRLSTRVFRGRGVGLEQISTQLRANYALSGSYERRDDSLRVRAELADVRSGTVLWTRELKGTINEMTSGSSDMLDQLVAETSASIIVHELARAQVQPLPTLECYTLLMSVVNLFHRTSMSSFDRAREMLDELTARAPSHPLPRAWLARWHVMRLNQGWASDPAAEALKALDYCKSALDADPHSAFALATDGFAHLHFRHRFDIASDRFDLALEANPNESLAWLWKGAMHAFRGEGESAVGAAERALRLSPLDPRRSYYESMAAAAAVSAGQYDRAIELAQRSLRLNRLHASALRGLAVAQVGSGRIEEARETVAELLRIEPTLTVSRYLARNPAGEFATGKRWGEALRVAGLPE